MRDTEALARRIRLGEDSTLEFKRILVSGSRVADPKRDGHCRRKAANGQLQRRNAVFGVADRSRENRRNPFNGLNIVELGSGRYANDH